ncbi:alpha/beta fold hydrolase [Pikeienuella sp. HZG-20]|uniref:alpha/beta fold hydrolase n=1 Tax=Paludibacillus litoralis TaxID=3133267 RepID=UPI0030EC9441
MIELAATEYPAVEETEAPPLVIAHGIFGSARNWRAIAKRLAAKRRVLVVDMRNHGDSPWADAHDYLAMAGDLAGVIERNGGRASVLGHSMGGKAAMVLAETRPELVERLIVADIAPVPYAHTRDLMVEIEAMRAVDLGPLARRAEVEAALGVYIGSVPVRSFLAQSAILGDTPRWSINLDALSANIKAISGYPDIGGVYEGPVLMLHGEDSDYVLPKHHAEILARFPAAEFQALEGAGHWIHADQPRAFLNAVLDFIAR